MLIILLLQRKYKVHFQFSEDCGFDLVPFSPCHCEERSDVAIRISTFTVFRPCGGWWIRFAFILPSAGRMNIGSHQFLNWWQQVSTGHLHLEGFESHHPHSKTKTPAVKAGVLFWWGMVDSNHRRHSQQIYSLSPLATREIPHIHFRSLEPVDGLV